ncbi:MAG: pyridoxine 5'-phosphate synthase [Vampirovibrionales bacterium]
MSTRHGITLGVNIDHVATVRNARGTRYPCPVDAARWAEAGGADGITVHLREDRRHIVDADVVALRQTVTTHLNLEMANTPEMIAFALSIRPDYVTLVPERREEITTEGGLDVIGQTHALAAPVQALQSAGIPVSLFIEPDEEQIIATVALGAQWIELHTGRYCDLHTQQGLGGAQGELNRLHSAALLAQAYHLGVNAGHGLTRYNVGPVLALPHLKELNIGHSLIADALEYGLTEAVRQMKTCIGSA